MATCARAHLLTVLPLQANQPQMPQTPAAPPLCMRWQHPAASSPRVVFLFPRLGADPFGVPPIPCAGPGDLDLMTALSVTAAQVMSWLVETGAEDVLQDGKRVSLETP